MKTDSVLHKTAEKRTHFFIYLTFSLLSEVIELFIIIPWLVFCLKLVNKKKTNLAVSQKVNYRPELKK